MNDKLCKDLEDIRKDDCKCEKYEGVDYDEHFGKDDCKCIECDTKDYIAGLEDGLDTLDRYKTTVDTTLLREWTTLMESTLDVVQLVSGNHWPPARSKLLRLFNDFGRNIRKELDIPLSHKPRKDKE